MSGCSYLPATLLYLQIIGRPSVPLRLFMKFSIINRTNVLTLGSLLSEHPHLSLSIHTRSSAMPD